MRKVHRTDSGKPVLTKSETPKYGRWKSSTISTEFTLGKEEKGSAIAADTMKKEKNVYIRIF